MKTLVEEMLPARFLADYAVYMQSCAHLELTIWHILQLASNEDTETEEHLASHVKLRISAYDLRRNLRKAVTLCPAHLGIRICWLANKIDAGFENRNLAAHGAWHTSRSDGSLRVEHYWKRGHGKNQNFFHMTDPITEHQVKTGVEEADHLLRTAVEIREQLYRWRASRGEGKSTMIGRAFAAKEAPQLPPNFRAWIEDVRLWRKPFTPWQQLMSQSRPQRIQ